MTVHSGVIFVFVMSAEWFDNDQIVRHLANEETSARGSQPYGKAGSGFGPRRPAPDLVSLGSFPWFTKTMPWSFSTNQPDFWLCRETDESFQDILSQFEQSKSRKPAEAGQGREGTGFPRIVEHCCCDIAVTLNDRAAQLKNCYAPTLVAAEDQKALDF